MSKRGSDHNRVQKAARVRDGGICQICGSRDHVQGHHVVDYQYGGKADLNNLVTLCKGCHGKVHKGKMDVYSW